MIPTHVLTDLKPDERVAVLSRGGEIHFHVHPASDEPDAVRAFAAAGRGRGCWPPTCRPRRDPALVASRERDVGGEG